MSLIEQSNDKYIYSVLFLELQLSEFCVWFDKPVLAQQKMYQITILVFNVHSFK